MSSGIEAIGKLQPAEANGGLPHVRLGAVSCASQALEGHASTKYSAGYIIQMHIG